LLHRAADLATAEYDSHYKSELVAELQQTLEVLVLPKRCLQFTLETVSANPFTPADSPLPTTGYHVVTVVPFVWVTIPVLFPRCVVWEYSRSF
jgi:hypothetical protein